MGRHLRIGLLIESSRAYGRNLLYGIAAYAKAHGPWTLYYQERAIDAPMPAAMRRWRPDGLLVRIVDARFGRQVLRLGVPTVGLLGLRFYRGVPEVIPDQAALTHLAAEHLLQRGLRQFAYVGFRKVLFSDQRREFFRKYMQAKGFQVHVFEDGGLQHAVGLSRIVGLSQIEEDTARHGRELADWLSGLPKPVGVYACNDIRAYQVLSVCGEYGIAVPDAVAVVGVDNDPVLCQLSDPPLSSVDPNAGRIGYEAAGTLHRMIDGSGPLPPSQILIAPAGVVPRLSTDILAVADREVADAVRYIRQHACDGVSVVALAERAAMSRRTLERRFAQHVGHSPSTEITRVQLRRVQELLVGSDFSLEKVARAAGFSHLESMHRLFKNTFALTPGEYRKSQRPIGTAEMPRGLDF